MKESIIQRFRTLAIYALIGLPLFWIAQWIYQSNQSEEYAHQEAPVVDLDLSLSGPWKFTILDNPQWKEKDVQDQNWESLEVPGAWEAQGFQDYNGYAWYRRKVALPQHLQGKFLDFYAGRIDDVDEVYIDGRLTGKTGQFPPRFSTAYNTFRIYHLSPEQTQKSEIQIAIRVFDGELEGGILEGPLGFKIQEAKALIDFSLEGLWEFQTSNGRLTQPDQTKESWTDIYVPSTWEDQGHHNYNGYGWYKKSFEINAEEAVEDWVLVLGKIDDIDQTFLNGEMIGSSGDSDAWEERIEGSEWLKERAYLIPAGLLKAGENTIKVRVFDAMYQGGIYEGPIGLVLQKNYTRYWKEKNLQKQASLLEQKQPTSFFSFTLR